MTNIITTDTAAPTNADRLQDYADRVAPDTARDLMGNAWRVQRGLRFLQRLNQRPHIGEREIINAARGNV